MALSEEAKQHKREYNRNRQRTRRGYGLRNDRGVRGDRDYKGKGVVTDGNVVIPHMIRGNVVMPVNPRTMTKRRLVDYLAYAGKRGFCLVETSRGYELAAVGIGQLVPFDSLDIIERQLRVQGQDIAQLKTALGAEQQRNTQLEADMARLEAMLDTTLKEEHDAR